MELMVFCVALFSVLVTLTYGQKCLQITQCQYDMQTYADAQAQGDIPTLCNLLGTTVECMELALEDCEKNEDYPKNLLIQARQSLETNKQQVNAFCPGSHSSSVASGSGSSGAAGHGSRSGGIPEQASCAEIMSCMFDIAQFQSAINQNRISDACGLVSPTVKCLRSATKDCKDRQVMNSNDIAMATKSLQDSEKLLEAHCGYTIESTSMKPTTTMRGSSSGSEDKVNSDNLESNYNTVNDDSNNSVHVDSEKQEGTDGGNNMASSKIISLSVMVALLVLCFENLFHH